MTKTELDGRLTRRNPWLLVGLIGAIVAIVGLALRGGSSDGPALPDGVESPSGGVVLGADAPVVVDEWFDFECPACADANASLSRTIGDLVEAGTIEVVYHPLSFVTPTGSALAANAFGCAADQGLAREFHDAALKAQGGPGGEFTNEALVAIGKDVGIDDPGFVSCVDEGTYQEWVDNVAAAGPEAGVSVTPTYVVDGEPLVIPENDPQVLKDAVMAAYEAE